MYESVVRKMYVQLYTKSVYSLLKSSVKLEEYVARAKAVGMKAIALTDEVNTYGLLKFYQLCIKAGIKPILGLTLTIDNVKVIMLATTNRGYQNLLRLSTLAKLNEEEVLQLKQVEKHSDDLIAILPLKNNTCTTFINNNQFEPVLQYIAALKQIFPSLFLGTDLVIQNQEFQQKVDYLATMHQLPQVAVHEVLYLDQAGYETYRFIDAIRKGEKLQLETLYLYPPEHTFIDPNLISSPTEAHLNTLKISELCQVELSFNERHLPKFTPPAIVSSDNYLKRLCLKGLEKRLGSEPIPQVYLDRLKYELTVIQNMGFSDYFLVVYDYVKFAKMSNIIVGPGRGSAAGSLVAYVLGITNVDPIMYNLLFERFLNPERVSMPDIDIDFEDEKRDAVIKYVQEKYGKFHVAHIIAFGTFGARSALRELGKVLNITDLRMNEIISNIDSMKSIRENIDQNPKLGLLIRDFPDIARLFKFAEIIEGIPRHTSTHAAGIIICENDLTDYTALQPGPNDVLQTQYEATDLELLGLLKMDFLGLRNLTMIGEIMELVKEQHGVLIDLNQLPLNDRKTYQLISRGHTLGVFQLESDGMRNVLQKLKASHFEDIVAVNALFRPGPMDQIDEYVNRKQGITPVEYLHEDLIPILRPTYGIIVYQEQIMEIAQQIAGFSLGRADLLRRAVSKKDREQLEKEQSHFIQGALAKGYNLETAEKLYDYILRFGDYGFNRSHSVAYGLIAYQMAYFKANYPVEFMTVLLSGVISSEKQTLSYLKECRKLGINILPISINRSHNKYLIENNKNIRLSLLNLKGVGQNMAHAILEERDAMGPFQNYQDFVVRTRHFMKQNVFKALVFGGALDEFNMTKRAMIENYDKVINYLRFNPSGYFDNQMKLDPYPEYETPILMQNEKSVLGFYFLTHPIHQVLTHDEKRDFILPNEAYRNLNRNVNLVGYVEQVKTIVTKKKEVMMTMQISDDTYQLSGVIFPSQYMKLSESVKANTLMRFKGRISKNQDKIQLVIQQVEEFSR